MSSLTFGLGTCRELLAKLERDAAALDEEVTSDRFFNFVVTGYSLIDWIKHDPSVPGSAKAHSAVQGLYAEPWLKICGDLATAGKHFKLTSRAPITASADSSQGFGVGRYGKGGYGVGEEGIDVVLNDGTTYTCIDISQGVVSAWRKFFSDHGL